MIQIKSFSQEYLCSPIGTDVAYWTADADSHNWGWGELYLTARGMAKFGLLYLREGECGGKQVLPAAWIRESLRRYSDGIDISGWLPGLTSRYGYFRSLGYGYQWWSARAGAHRFNYAVGHGGQLIVLLDELDIVIVTTADPLCGPDLVGEGGR